LTGVPVKGLGAHIILARDNAKRVMAAQGDAAVRGVVTDLRLSKRLREAKLVLESGTSWDPIHRLLTDGTLAPNAGEFPLNHAVLGGKRLYREADFEAVLVRPDIVAHVADALHHLKRGEVQAKYLQIDPQHLGHVPGEKEFEVVWSTLQQVRLLFEDAANERCAVLFTVEK
jgi:hypothetical protein